MKLHQETYHCNRIDELPTSNFISDLDRGINLKVIFGSKIKNQRQKIGESWQEEFPNYSIGIHLVENEINIHKLITFKEVDENWEYFENCAIQYRNLATSRIYELAKHLEIEIFKEFPLKTLNPWKNTSYESHGEIDTWKYYFHGFHCCFENLMSGQTIEVPLTYGLEFGELDPYFFCNFINTSPELSKHDLKLYNLYRDGNQILERMCELGKFIEIQSNIKGNKGITVKKGHINSPRIYKEAFGGAKIHKVNFKLKRKPWWKRILSK